MLRVALLFGILATVPRLAVSASDGVGPPVGAPVQTPGAGVGDDDERTPLPVPEPSPLAVRYHRTGQYLWAFGRFWGLAVPLGLLVTGASGRLRDRAVGVAGWLLNVGVVPARWREPAARSGAVWFVTVGLYVVLFLAVVYLVDFPLRYYAGFVRQHEYGLSRQSFGRWFGNSLKGLGVDMVGGACFAWVPFLLIRKAPRTWWLIVSALFVPFLGFVTLVMPVWVEPLFNDYGRLQDPALERKILDLAGRAGIAGGRVFEVNKSVDTRTANAYVTGLFGTKRIVLWDNLLRDFDEREVLAVMAHEMGHYALDHVAWSIVLSATVVLAGLFWTDRVGRRLLARFGARLGVASLADVAAAPLLLVLLGLSSTALAPVVLAYSRYHEHEADRFALDLTHLNRSTARAFADLQRENLGVPRQTLVDKLWRSTHPSAAERIEFCNTYRPWEPARPVQVPR